MATGRITDWFDERDYGFILADDLSDDAFLHRNQVLEGEPRAGAIVHYEIRFGRGKGPVAFNVKIL